MISEIKMRLMLAGSLILLVVICWMCVQVVEDPEWAIPTHYEEAEETLEEITERGEKAEKHTLTAHSKKPKIETMVFEVETLPTEAPIVTEEVYPVYRVDGVEIDRNLQRYLLTCLRNLGHEEFFEFALCQIYQESRGDINAVNPNGLDKGLLQFREIYWPEYSEAEGLHTANVFDPYAQIYVYTRLMARRLNSGLLIQEAISRHYTSDYGEYCQRYVSDVMQWYETLERVN